MIQVNQIGDTAPRDRQIGRDNSIMLHNERTGLIGVDSHASGGISEARHAGVGGTKLAGPTWACGRVDVQQLDAFCCDSACAQLPEHEHQGAPQLAKDKE